MEHTAQNPLLLAAIRYTKLGWQVFPCRPGNKQPITAHGYKDASDDGVKLVPQWKRCAKANIGIATGERSRIVVLDVDPRNGGLESLAELE